MKALITGGTGFIGSNLASHLADNSWDVIVYDNETSGVQANLKLDKLEQYVHGDILSYGMLDAAMENVDVVFHLAASVGNSRSIQNPILDSTTNVIGTLNILEAVRSHGVPKLVYSSSAAVYGEPEYVPIDEDHPVEPASPYGVSKLSGEKHCLCFGNMYETDVICLRYFNVYGPNQRYDPYGNVIPIFSQQLLHGEPLKVFGDGTQTRDFVHIDDVVRANVLAASINGVVDVFNVASGRATTLNQLATMTKRISGQNVKTEFLDPRQGDVKHSTADITKAEQVLNYKPRTSLQDGLREYYQWLSQVSS